MRNNGGLARWVIVAAWLSAAPALAGEMERPGARDEGVVVDHPPSLGGGLASDLSFTMYPSSTELWQQVASDFTLIAPATIRRVVFWGFYGVFNAPEDPPDVEVMRLRFYEPRISDGLPGAILYQQGLDDATRIPTGRELLGGLDEFRFEVDLHDSISLAASAPFWLEIVQVDDIDSHFRWENSATDGQGVAVRNANFPDWAQTAVADTAYQLSTIPEPSSLLLFGVVIASLVRRNRKGGVVRRKHLQL